MSTPASSSTATTSRLSGALLALAHLGWAAFFAWALFVALINVMLSTKLVHVLASSSPDSMIVDYRSGWSIWPGPVHVDGVHLRGQDDNVQWTLDVEHADTHIVLTDLPRLFFHCTDVHAVGASFRVRRRLDKSVNDPVYLAALPPIEGLAFPPRIPDQVAPSATPTQQLKLWQVEIDLAHVEHLAQIWVDDVRVDGDGDVDGAFFLAPTRTLSVGPAKITMRTGEVHAGDYTLVSALAGTFDFTMEPTSLALAPGGNILNYVALDAHATAKLTSLAGADYYLRGLPIHAKDGAGRMTIDLKIDRGVIQPASRLAVDATGVHLFVGPLATAFDLHAAFEADATEHALHLRATADALNVQSQTGIVWGTAPRFGFDLDLGSLDLERVAQAPSLSADLPDFTLPHLENFAALLKPGDFTVNSGTAQGSAHVDYQVVTQRGKTELALHGPVAVTYKGTKVTAGLAIGAKAPSFDLNAGEADLTGSRLELRDVRVDGSGGGPWWGRAEIDRGTTNWKRDPAVHMHTNVQAADARPVLLFLKDQDAIPGWITHVVSLNNVRAQSSIDIGGSGIDVEQLAVKGSDLDVMGDLHTHGAQSKSCFLFRSGPLEIGLDGRGPHSTVILLGAEDWFSHAAPCR